MGQAAVDLPDPLETPPETSTASTDDLLAQLAGDEIDRLLAEAESGRAPSVAVSAVVHAPVDVAKQPAESSVAENRGAKAVTEPEPEITPANDPAPASSQPVAEPSSQEAIEPAPIPASPFAASAPITTANASAAKSQLIVPGAIEPPPSLTASANTIPIAVGVSVSASAKDLVALADELAGGALGASVVADALAGRDIAVDVAADESTSDAEREGLVTTTLSDVLDRAIVGSESSSEEDQLPLLLRPLEWINAPLEACPEFVRETIGKVAILTLVNAVAVLAYVLIFR